MPCGVMSQKTCTNGDGNPAGRRLKRYEQGNDARQSRPERMMTNPKNILSAVTLAALVAASFTTIAKAEVGPQGGAMGQMFMFEEMDADKDGKLTQDEVKAHTAAQAALMDTDKDGTLSEAELIAGQQQRKADRESRRAKQMIERMDANKDGVLSLDEMAPPADRMVRMFKRVDADGDGVITKADRRAALPGAKTF